MPEQSCPLCNQNAKYINVDFGRKKRFACPQCKCFVISPDTEKLIIKTSEKHRGKISEASSTTRPETILLIWKQTDDQTIRYREEPKSNWF